MSKKVILAQTAGFCMGVSLALRKLDKTLKKKDKSQKIFTLGPIIHNPQVLQRYKDQGVMLAETVDKIHKGDLVVIRAHGIPKPMQQELEQKKAIIIDATCPKVKKAQMLIEEYSQEGLALLLFGEHDHPEVKGLLSYASQAVVFENLQQLEKINLEQGQFFLAAQTTQDREQFLVIQKYLQAIYPNISILDTICDATKNRQQEAINIAQQVQCMVVVGGYNSGNTRRLAAVAQEQGLACFHVETSSELPLAKLQNCKTIGLTAGASTPEDIIQEVFTALSNL